MDEKIVIMLIFVGFGIAEIIAGRFLNKDVATSRDWIMEVISTTIIMAVTVPATLFAVDWMGHHWFAEYAGVLSTLPIWVMVLLFLVGDDMTQYWWHRLSHSVPFLYNLHRAHHSAPYMSIRIVYRNNIFYYALMPGLWISAALVFLGLEAVYPWYLIVKLSVIFGAHSSVRWDEWLYKIPALDKVMWIVERTISTPATHSAHHGLHKEDGVTNYKGNYGNLLFFWDVLFGTAHITRRYPKQFGIEGLPDVSWQQELMWPVVGASNGVKSEAPANSSPQEA
ncbi:sterol desaturase family protein [Gimibacter soli]|uniref:Sterol desaturase family protein n=1 Tax=Gimibacter soli TaxID=3024400 RepID=A0AAE9XU89_9PROT|nr:sterol desaturase family protein [Gimibacter soli]WCL55071.1 sterol desaturase family protein [Gimibacter soli]